MPKICSYLCPVKCIGLHMSCTALQYPGLFLWELSFKASLDLRVEEDYQLQTSAVISFQSFKVDLIHASTLSVWGLNLVSLVCSFFKVFKHPSETNQLLWIDGLFKPLQAMSSCTHSGNVTLPLTVLLSPARNLWATGMGFLQVPHVSLVHLCFSFP